MFSLEILNKLIFQNHLSKHKVLEYCIRDTHRSRIKIDGYVGIIKNYTSLKLKYFVESL